MRIGDKVQVTAMGDIVAMRSNSDGTITYEVLNNATKTHCFVDEQSLINIHQESVKEEQRDAIANLD